MKRAISYLRFSSSKQSTGDSFRRQLHATEKFCRENKLELSKNRLEDLGVSAWSGKNLDDTSALGGFLKLVEAGKIPKGTVLIVENLDRLTRGEITDALELFLSIIRQGVEIVTTMDGKWYSRESIRKSPTDLMISIIYLTRGNNESETKSIRGKEAWLNRHNKISKGEFVKFHAPNWLSKKDNKYIVTQENDDKVKLIFDLYLKGYGGHALVKELIKRNIKSFSKSGEWTIEYIHKILTNPAVIGRFESSGMSVNHYYPACVTDEIFYKALEQRKKNTEFHCKTITAKYVNIFGGLCKCHKCGGNMVIHTGRGTSKNTKHKTYTYFICANSKISKCKYEFTPLDKFTDTFLMLINNMDFSSLIFAKEPKKDNTDALRGEIIELQKTIDRVALAVVKTESRTLENQLRQLEIDRASKEKKLQQEIVANAGQVDTKGEYQELIHAAHKKLKDNNFRLALRNLLRKHVEKIIVSADEYTILLNDSNDTVSVKMNEKDFQLAFGAKTELAEPVLAGVVANQFN